MRQKRAFTRWHHSTAYDPARHRALQRLLAAQDTAPHQAA
jgi:hypothetical protein